MTITLTVQELTNWNIQTNEVFLVSGILWLDADEARLYNWQDDQSIPIRDSEACSILRSHLAKEYLGGVLLQAWVQNGDIGLELHHIYWVIPCEPENDARCLYKWGEKIPIRPVPDKYDYSR
ncbi:hypothetical protein [Calothrix sp. PCC 6303]|uniref:hypothetical protein n=1 Tax=Calothrix sp. PCC 6303 TaxID=1170562 RepID=UPI0002A036EB|nr:hypothetical protein [Calothrix sp. PCC 6303]AFZ04282.1 hypothetical protein Cal6303_5399 [Calothrix sp. PCC 6303]